ESQQTNDMHVPRVTSGFVLLALAGALSACSPGSRAQAAAASDGRGELRVRRGDLVDTMVLTGEIEAADGAVIAVPRLPSWQTSIRWIAAEGTEISENEPVVELDAGEFASSLDGKRSALAQAEHQFAQKQSELSASLAEKKYDVERRKNDLDKAMIDALVPEDLLSRREYEERRLALERAQTEYQKADSTLEAAKTSGESDLKNLMLEVEKARRDVSVAESAIRTLTLRAPRGGVVVINEHPWEGRKLQTGDSVFIGMALAQIPDVKSLEVVGVLADVDDGRIAKGMPVTMTIDAFPERPFNGRVRDIAPVAQELGRGSLRRGFRVVVPIDDIDPERMRPGLSVRMVVERERTKEALLAPRVALDVMQGRARRVSGETVEIELGPCSAQECVVEKGLAEGDALGPFRIREAGS
ncbi:MAG TPA: efflux RND transporter periplasmic adaptor subunit, partial [Thermoanaerobaculia bacterium]|nr:efflux RND transporter periplasmic adaptor subunit [Thermoanaerobaculia bacterium]